MNFASKRGQRLLAGYAEREQSQGNFASKRGQRLLAGYAEREQSQAAAGGLKVRGGDRNAARAAEKRETCIFNPYFLILSLLFPTFAL